MNELKTIRWKQRFENFEKAFLLLRDAIKEDNISHLERAGLIQFFEMCFELAWKVLKDYLESTGTEVKSPRDSIKVAFQQELIANGYDWIDALTDRNLTVHTYDEATAVLIEEKIKKVYFPLLEKMNDDFKKKL